MPGCRLRRCGARISSPAWGATRTTILPQRGWRLTRDTETPCVRHFFSPKLFVRKRPGCTKGPAISAVSFACAPATLRISMKRWTEFAATRSVSDHLKEYAVAVHRRENAQAVDDVCQRFVELPRILFPRPVQVCIFFVDPVDSYAVSACVADLCV